MNTSHSAGNPAHPEHKKASNSVSRKSSRTNFGMGKFTATKGWHPEESQSSKNHTLVMAK